MPEKTEAQKRAQKNYMDKFVRVEIRMEPERRDKIKAIADEHGKSLNSFINEAIDEKIQRDSSSP